MRYQLISHKNGKTDKKLQAYLTVALVQRQSSWMRDVLGGKYYIKQQNIDDTAYIRVFRYIGRYLAHRYSRTVGWGPFSLYHLQFDHPVLSSSVHVLAFFMHRRRSISLSFSLFPCPLQNLAVANSCTNVNVGRDGFTNCFSLPPPTANPFYTFFFSPLSRAFISFSFSSPHLRIRSHEPYRGNSTFVFVFRRHRWLDWQSRKNRQDEGNGGGREKFRKVKMREVRTYSRGFY